MKPKNHRNAKSTGSGLIVPLLGCVYGFFVLCCKRRTKLGLPMSDQDAAWFSIPVFGLALFFHARYFDYYRRYPSLRWCLMILAILVIAGGLAGVFAPWTRDLI